MKFTSSYLDHAYYNNAPDGYFLRKSHAYLEAAFDKDAFFRSVIEVGSGPCNHLAYLRHRFERYVNTDLDVSNLEYGRKHLNYKKDLGAVDFVSCDAKDIPFGDNEFDRLIASHALEHIVSPEDALREWVRVVKVGGIISVLIPCDPGLMWRLGRWSIVEGRYKSENIPYRYLMAKEHVNSIFNLVEIMKYIFDEYDIKFYPFRIPSADFNLFCVAHIVNVK